MFLIKNLKDLKDFAKQMFNRTCSLGLLSLKVLYVSIFQTIDQGGVLRTCCPKSKVKHEKNMKTNGEKIAELQVYVETGELSGSEPAFSFSLSLYLLLPELTP